MTSGQSIEFNDNIVRYCCRLMSYQLKDKLRKTVRLKPDDYIDNSYKFINDYLISIGEPCKKNNDFLVCLEKVTPETYKGVNTMLANHYVDSGLVTDILENGYQVVVRGNLMCIVDNNDQVIASQKYVPDRVCIINWYCEGYTLILPQINSLHCSISDDNNLVVNLPTNQNLRNFLNKVIDIVSEKIKLFTYSDKINLNTSFGNKIKLFIKNKCCIFKKRNDSYHMLMCHKENYKFKNQNNDFDSQKILPKNGKIDISINAILTRKNDVFELLFYVHQMQVTYVEPYFFDYGYDSIIITQK
ncbi:hypothetical protein Catovirus_1_507 [Catovirus CTV1]|uniref:Uncharacterized protein n=1 Tax=Catovirus CTV1 TaxID=1977631 RepID=A0A1V0S9R0_9VIRU|nr:hypothetical protein Catovirus_1_507 [Catovirus CTV1]